MTNQQQQPGDMAMGMMAQAQAELSRVQQQYREWKSRQEEAMTNMEIRLEQRRADIADEVSMRARALATAIAEEQLKVETYAQAIQQAITATENPYQYSGSGQPFRPSSSAGPLTLPS